MALRQPLILKPRKIVVTIFVFESLSPWTLSFIGSVTALTKIKEAQKVLIEKLFSVCL